MIPRPGTAKLTAIKTAWKFACIYCMKLVLWSNRMVGLCIFHFLWDHWAHSGYFKTRILLKPVLRGVCSLASYIQYRCIWRDIIKPNLRFFFFSEHHVNSRVSLSRSSRDSLKQFEISVPRHIRFAELRKKISLTASFQKWIYNLTPKFGDILKILWKRGAISPLFYNILLPVVRFTC